MLCNASSARVNDTLRELSAVLLLLVLDVFSMLSQKVPATGRDQPRLAGFLEPRHTES